MNKKAIIFAVTLASPASVGAEGREPHKLVQLEVAARPVEADQTGQPFLYAIPSATETGGMKELAAQNWSMLGREDRAAAISSEYAPVACESVAGWRPGKQNNVDVIAARAAKYRIVIVNESHIVTRHREMMRRLLPKLRRLGFSVLAMETLTNAVGRSAPVDEQAKFTWPHQNDG